jgi:hypothetical protein
MEGGELIPGSFKCHSIGKVIMSFSVVSRPRWGANLSADEEEWKCEAKKAAVVDRIDL